MWLAGDGQYDSPGYCGKYCSYSVMDLKSEKILDFEVVQRKQVVGDLEKAGCERVLRRLRDGDHVPIKLMATDRHRGIGLLMRTTFPEVHHEFDVWHLAKSLQKKIRALEKKTPQLAQWKAAISHHLWWSSMTCQNNADSLVERFTSLLNHVVNVHSWSGGTIHHECAHPPLSADDIRVKKWFNPRSEAFAKLKRIIEDKTFLKDIRHASNYCHTGGLEAYHSTRLKFLPKRLHFGYVGMCLRSIIAILDHNNNVGRKAKSQKAQYSKVSARWVLKNVYELKTSTWKRDILSEVLACVVTPVSSDLPSVTKPADLPANIAPVPRPSIEALRRSYQTRYPNKQSADSAQAAPSSAE